MRRYHVPIVAIGALVLSGCLLLYASSPNALADCRSFFCSDQSALSASDWREDRGRVHDARGLQCQKSGGVKEGAGEAQ